MKWYDIEQNSEEWLELRLGKFTASSFADLFMKKDTATYEKAILRVVFERLTGESPEFFESEYMKRGHEIESLARQEYEETRFEDVQPGGFFVLNEYVGASPDGLIGDDGLLEIKSPAFNTMIKYLQARTLPIQYKWQVQGQLLVTGRKWCDFMAYHPKLPVFITRVYPDQAATELLKAELDTAIGKVIEVMETINQHLIK